ncbi:hypothetical protein KY285_016419 [Solanum tuberosum]|nr:hypothetical protein KY284_016418 [Solanum tuberosum]KAH0702141.1 hypothetical protein KY285_016419 [Solanum tuberosum]
MPRTRASISSDRGEAVHEAIVEAQSRDRGRVQARGHVCGVEPTRDRAHGAKPARGRAREVSPKPQVEVVEEQVPLEFGVHLFQETLLRMLGVLENFSHGGATCMPQGYLTRVGPQTPSQQHVLGIHDHVVQPLVVLVPTIVT